jgi:hypothetical protein
VNAGAQVMAVIGQTPLTAAGHGLMELELIEPSMATAGKDFEGQSFRQVNAAPAQVTVELHPVFTMHTATMAL